MSTGNELVLNGRYQLLGEVKASLSSGRIELGSTGQCRFCGATDPKYFRTLAHTFPAALGNRWVMSRDECDQCNDKFSKYEDALVKGVGPILTLGGTRGRDNKIRKTGRSHGPIRLRRDEGGTLPRPSLQMIGPIANARFGGDPATGVMCLSMPTPYEPFVPRHAYKALTKMGLALLPLDELPHYGRLREWLLDVDDAEDFGRLEVAISFGGLGRALPLVAGSLLRRVDPADVVPHILFIFCAGSICLQIDLMSDHLEDHLPPVPLGLIKIAWAIIIGDKDRRREVRIDYGSPTHLNWASTRSEPPPIKELQLEFNTHTTEGRLIPIL